MKEHDGVFTYSGLYGLDHSRVSEIELHEVPKRTKLFLCTCLGDLSR